MLARKIPTAEEHQVEERTAKLESDVTHIASDVAENKTGMRDFRNETQQNFSDFRKEMLKGLSDLRQEL